VMGLLRSPAFSLYARDILCSATIRKLHTTEGIRPLGYLYLLCSGWIEDEQATFPEDRDELAAMARVTRDEFEKLWVIIGHQFVSNGNGRLYNPRLYHEYEKQLNRRGKDAKRTAMRRANNGHHAVATPFATPVATKLPENEIEDENENEEEPEVEQFR